MAEQSLIVAELKHALRMRGLTYSAVAGKLELSVPSVKRLFSAGDLSLKRVRRSRRSSPIRSCSS